MFGRVNVWRIAELKEIGGLIDFIHKDAIYMLNFGWLKFGEPRITRQIRQTFPQPNISAIRYISKLVFVAVLHELFELDDITKLSTVEQHCNYRCAI